MICPECTADNPDSAESCSSCGHGLALPVGTVLAGRYEIKSPLGVGGLGRVYRAHDRMLDEVVAVKVLHPEAARSDELKERFRSEIRLARKVRHRNVCAIHEYGEHEGYRFVAMELVEGVDLHRVLQEHGPLPPMEAFDVCIQVSRGLAAIHEAGVIHRDLKTPNIMRDRQGGVRLLDFGIAKLITSSGAPSVTAVHKVVGTPEYMSPEQIRGDDLDERTDIYGLGVVIYELFTGVVPFQGKSPVDTLVMQVSSPPPLHGEAAARLLPSLVPVLHRCLAKSPNERYGSARELLDALRAARSSAFPEGPVTSQGMPVVDAEPAMAPLQAQATAPLPIRPVGPPKNPLPGAPPPLVPRPRAPSGAWGVGLALIGLAAVVSARVWQHYRSSAPPPSHVTLAAAARPTPTPSTPKDSTSSKPTDPGRAAPEGESPPVIAESPTAAPVQSPSSARPSEAVPLPEGSAPNAPSALHSTRRPSRSPSPTPSPTPELTPASRSGTLDLEARPGAEVEVDGRDVGQAPLAGLEVDAGNRVLRLIHPDYWPVTRHVLVERDKALRLDVDLSWEGVPRARSKAAPFSEAIDGSPSDTYFDRGLRQLAEGDFQEAILTLEPVALRLELAGKVKELARAEFYLGIALLELNRQGRAMERFQDALQHDSSLRVPGGAFSPKITSFFGTVRDAGKKKP